MMVQSTTQAIRSMPPGPLRITGTKTWHKGIYYIRFANKGTNMASADKYMLSQDVAPGESVTFVADMVAPSQEGLYVSNWFLVNDNGGIFYNFYVAINVKP